MASPVIKFAFCASYSHNVAVSAAPVKRVITKTLKVLMSFFAICALCGSGLANAEDARTLAMVNSTRLLTALAGAADVEAHPKGLPNMLKNIAEGKITRATTKFPVWILDSEADTVLYYQGEPSFTGKPASMLVDDAGVRFGMAAVEKARLSKASWHNLVLGGRTYNAYCGSKIPFVVCTLIIE